MEEQFDLIIIGGGAAAFAAAIKASEFGAKVAMVERGALGGTCVNVGCVPTKFLLTAGERVHAANTSPSHFRGLGTSAGPTGWPELIKRKNEIVSGERQSKYADVLASYPNVKLYENSAAFVSDTEVRVGDDILTAPRFLIATGASTRVPPIPGIETVPYLTNVDALELPELPQSIIVVGGRAMGLEFAQMFARFGSEVTLLQRGPQILTGAEPEVAEILRTALEAEGIRIVTGVTTTGVRGDDGNVTIAANVEGQETSFSAAKLLVATGRHPNTADLELEKAGLRVNNQGAVVVDEHMLTSNGRIWAAGDVTGEPMLETVAAKAGSIAAHNAFSASKKTLDLTVVPKAVFTDPSVASVGLTDAEAQKLENVSCSCRSISFDLVPKAKIVGRTDGVIKMVTDARTKRILGIHICSALAHELIHEATIIVKYKLTTDDVIDTIHVFPTLSESLKLVAQSFTKDISKMSCCVE